MSENDREVELLKAGVWPQLQTILPFSHSNPMECIKSDEISFLMAILTFELRL